MNNELSMISQQTNSLQKKAHLFHNALDVKGATPIYLEHYKSFFKAAQRDIAQQDMIWLHQHFRSKDEFVQDFIALDGQMRTIKKWAKQMVIDRVPIAICGKPGVGKRHIAQWIHRQDLISEGLFLELDCLNMTEQSIHRLLNLIDKLPEETMQQLLRHSVICIHRIDVLSFDLQDELLEQLILEPGLAQQIRFVITLEHSIEESYHAGFLCDSVYAYMKESINVPSLQERPQEISSFVSLFLKQVREKRLCRRLKIEKEAMDHLSNYEWPGNLIELRQFIEKLASQEVETITKQAILGALPAAYVEQVGLNLMSLADAEQAVIERVLQVCGNTLEGKKKAADILKISLSTLYNKMKIYNLS